MKTNPPSIKETLKKMSLARPISIGSVVLGLWLCNSTALLAQESTPIFKELSVVQGLSQNSVTAILQDTFGFIWIGTNDGLNRFDGYSVTNFHNEPGNPFALGDDQIECLYLDQAGVVWVGTTHGLYFWDQRAMHFNSVVFYPEETLKANLGKFHIRDINQDVAGTFWISTHDGLYRFKMDQNVPDPIPVVLPPLFTNQALTHFAFDSKNELWIGTLDEGVIRYNQDTQTAVEFRHVESDRESLAGNTVHDIFISPDDQVWIAAIGGMSLFNESNQKFTVFPLTVDGESSEITGIVRESESILWLGTTMHGLCRFDQLTHEYSWIKNIRNEPRSLNPTGIISVFLDSSNILWLGSRGAGLQYTYLGSKFQFYTQIPGNANSLSGQSVRAIFEDNDANLWVSTYGGLDRFPKNSGDYQAKHYGVKAGPILAPGQNCIFAFYQDKSGFIWMASEGGGLFRFDPRTDQYQNFRHDPDDPHSLPTDFLFALHADSTGQLWVGTLKGLVSFDPNHPLLGFTRHQMFTDPGNIGSNTGIPMVTSIESDGAANFWVGTDEHGLFRYNQRLGEWSQYIPDRDDIQSINGLQIKSMLLDSKNRLWIGTNNGLNLFQPETNQFINFTQSEGYPDDMIYSILEDADGFLWLSTNKGLVCYNPNTDKYFRYDVEYGLQSNEFNGNAGLKSQTGELYFGGIFGMTAFQPAQVREKRPASPLVFLNCRVSNKVLPVDTKRNSSKLALPQALNTLDGVQFSQYEKVLSFEFAALDYINPTRLRYAYRLTGVDKQWIETDASLRVATYTNLPAGQFSFQIKVLESAISREGAIKSLSLMIRPYPWLSWWAYTIYILLFFGALWTVRRMEIRRLQTQTELKQRRSEVAKNREVEQLKARLITNIALELSQPLTMLSNGLKQFSVSIQNKLNPGTQNQLSGIESQAVNAQELVEQLFDLGQFTSGRITLRAQPTDIRRLLNETIVQFGSYFENTPIKLVADESQSGPDLYLDVAKMGEALKRILIFVGRITLMGTPIRVTLTFPEKSKIEFGSGAFVQITFAFHGNTLTSNLQDGLFDDLLYSDELEQQNALTNEVSLLLTKELIGLHGGAISLQRTDPEYFRITIDLPEGRAHLGEQLIVQNNTVRDSPGAESHDELPPLPQVHSGKTILLVEDDKHLCRLIQNRMESHFTVISTLDGQAGFERAAELIPDCIISDVKMPVMDGIQLVRKIRETPELKHIPIILLTAMQSEEDRMRGYKAEADFYVTKPFNVEQLFVQVQNLMALTERLAERSSRTDSVISKHSTFNKIDEKFLNRVVKIVEDNLTDTDFNMDDLAKSCYLSKRQLERRIRELLDISPADYVRRIRLEKARQLLESGAFSSVSEVAVAVGYPNVKYFAQLFKSHFGNSPSDWI